jgi:hypothetical protein
MLAWILNLGFAASPAGTPTPTPTPEASKPAGRPRRRHYFVEIDGQSFQVTSPDHAGALLERAREIAATHARQIAEEAARTTRKVGKRPIALPTPRISSPDEELAQVISNARTLFNELYRTAAIEAELAYLMQRAMDDDEDDALLLLIN